MSKMGQGRSVSRIAIDLLLAASILFIGSQIVQTAMRAASVQAEFDYAVKEAQTLYEGLQRYHERNRAFPNTYATPRLELDTLDPLRRKGYYDGGILSVLQDGRIDAYDSPDDRGLNHEFWIEMTLAGDPSVRLLVARSDDAPLSDGRWVDGVDIYRDGELETR